MAAGWVPLNIMSIQAAGLLQVLRSISGSTKRVRNAGINGRCGSSEWQGDPQMKHDLNTLWQAYQESIVKDDYGIYEREHLALLTELRGIKRRIENGTPNAKKYGAVTLTVIDQILGVES